MSASSASPVGCVGRVSKQGAIRPGRLGEVLVPIRGGIESFLAKDADGGSIDADEEIVVVAAAVGLVLVAGLLGVRRDRGSSRTAH